MRDSECSWLIWSVYVRCSVFTLSIFDCKFKGVSVSSSGPKLLLTRFHSNLEHRACALLRSTMGVLVIYRHFPTDENWENRGSAPPARRLLCRLDRHRNPTVASIQPARVCIEPGQRR